MIGNTIATGKKQESLSIWKPFVKTKLPTFISDFARTKMKIADKVDRLKEEKEVEMASIYLDVSAIMNFQLYLDQCFNETVASVRVHMNRF